MSIYRYHNYDSEVMNYVCAVTRRSFTVDSDIAIVLWYQILNWSTKPETENSKIGTLCTDKIPNQWVLQDKSVPNGTV